MTRTETDRSLAAGTAAAETRTARLERELKAMTAERDALMKSLIVDSWSESKSLSGCAGRWRVFDGADIDPLELAGFTAYEDAVAAARKAAGLGPEGGA